MGEGGGSYVKDNGTEKIDKIKKDYLRNITNINVDRYCGLGRQGDIGR